MQNCGLESSFHVSAHERVRLIGSDLHPLGSDKPYSITRHVSPNGFTALK